MKTTKKHNEFPFRYIFLQYILVTIWFFKVDKNRYKFADSKLVYISNTCEIC